MSLDELLRAARLGDVLAQKRLFVELHGMLLPYFSKRVGAFEAEDLTQHTLEIIFKELKTFESRGPGSLRSFAFTVAHYRVLSHHKTKRPRREEWKSPGAWTATPERSPTEVTQLLQQAPLLREAMATVKTTFRRALESRLRDDDPRLFAAKEGIRVATVRSRVRRAVAIIYAEIQARRKTPRRSPRELTPTPT